ncbi:hypothetical protein D3C71_188880 [compost metagenome]
MADDVHGDQITIEEIEALFGDEIPMVAFKLLFPEKSKPLTLHELRTALRSLSSSQRKFQHRLIENAFSWALQDCNYLNPKYMDRLIGETMLGMKPEQAAGWNATSSRTSD